MPPHEYPSAARIPEATEPEAIAALAALAQEHWREITAEFQDDGTFLLLTVQAPSISEEQLTDLIRQEVVTALDRLIPDHACQPTGSWMVVFVKQGEVFASIFPSQDRA